MALDNLRGGTKRVVEETAPLNNLRGGTKRVVIVDGGGGSVDYAKTVQRAETMPTADASNAGQQFLYSGESDATYTHGYIYECVSDGGNPATYSWTRVDVQPAPVIPDPLPSQTGNAGKFLTTDGTDASWSDKPLVNTATGTNSLTILGSTNSRSNCVNIGAASIASNNGVTIGYGAGNSSSTYGVAIGTGAITTTSNGYEVAIGTYAAARANRAIQIGRGDNSDANTFKVANANGNFEIMSADGTIPEARLADTTNAAQGQVLTLDSNLNAVWQAGGGGGNYLPLTGGTLTGIITQDIGTSGWADFVAVKNTSYPNNPTVLQVQSNTTSSLNFRVKSGGNISLTSVYGISASEVAGSIGSPKAPFNSISVEMIFARGSNYNYPITVPQNTTGTMVVATPPTADGTYVLKATVSSGVVTYAWVAE